MFSALKSFKVIEMVKTQAARASTFPSYKALMVSNPKPYVVHVELNRPEKMNAMDRTMWT